MAAAIPTTEPTQVYAGDTWGWSRSLGDYPAPTWVATYTFNNATERFSFAAVASGTDQLVARTSAQTENIKPGTYRWDLRVSDGTTRTTLEHGQLEVLPNLAGTAPQDLRTQEEIALDAINAVLANRATLDQEEYRIADRMLKRTPFSELREMKRYYQALVNKQRGMTGRIFIRYGGNV